MHSAKLYGQVETKRKLRKMSEEKKVKEVVKKDKPAPKPAAPKVAPGTDLTPRP